MAKKSAGNQGLTTTNATNKQQTKKAEKIDEYHKLEITEMMTRIRTHGSLRTQYYSFWGTAHFVALGLAFTTQKLSVLIISIIPLIAVMLISRNLRKTEVAIELRALELENKYAPDSDAALLHLIIAVSHSSSNWLERLNAINKINKFGKKVDAARKTSFSLASGVLIPLLILLEIGIGINLWIAGWNIF